MGSSDPELIVDQEGNLSSSKKPVLFLGFLFLETDLLLDLGILDDLVQSRSNLRVKYLSVWKMFSKN